MTHTLIIRLCVKPADCRDHTGRLLARTRRGLSSRTEILRPLVGSARYLRSEKLKQFEVGFLEIPLRCSKRLSFTPICPVCSSF
jgi:hypothetical protein